MCALWKEGGVRLCPLLRKKPSLSPTPSSCVAALNPFEEQENVDARFVEETALKQTLILLGFDQK